MSWPTNKANTTYTDSDTDLISLARPDLNQNIINVNSIIDYLDISNPQNGDTLVYDGAQGKFVAGPSSGTTVLSFNSQIPGGSGSGTYSGDFTVYGSSVVSRVSSSEINLPDGKYLIGVIEPMEAGNYGSTSTLWSLTLVLRNSAGTALATYKSTATSFYFNDFDDNKFITVSGNNNCYWTYDYSPPGDLSNLTMVPVKIEKIE